MICITGAGGTVGRAVLEELQRRNTSFRAAYFSTAKAEAARSRGIDAATIDYRDPTTLRAAFEGITTLFLLAPNVTDQSELELNAVHAARGAGVAQVVKLSVLGAEEGGYLLARIHRQVETALEQSGMTWTFLRPNSFMQNVETFMLPSIRAEAAFYTASADASVAHVDVRDIAAVAAEALTDPAHAHRAYTLTGPEAISYEQVAKALSAAAGRRIRHVSLELGELQAAMVAGGVDEEMAARLVDLEKFFRNGGASVVTDDLRAVARRAPRTFHQYASELAPLVGAIS